jgi:hypothetical protein
VAAAGVARAAVIAAGVSATIATVASTMATRPSGVGTEQQSYGNSGEGLAEHDPISCKFVDELVYFYTTLMELTGSIVIFC